MIIKFNEDSVRECNNNCFIKFFLFENLFLIFKNYF